MSLIGLIAAGAAVTPPDPPGPLTDLPDLIPGGERTPPYTLPRPAVPKLRANTASRPATAPASLPSPKAPMSKIAAPPATSQNNDADWETF